MKKLVALIALSLVSVMSFGEERTGFIPPMEVGGGKLALRGFVWWTVTSSDGEVVNDSPYARLHANWDRPEGGLGAVFNFGHVGWDNGTVVEELYGKVRLTDTVEAYAGRLFTGPGYVYPAPDKREMEKPKALFFDAYAWGGMLVKTWETGSTAKLSLTGRPGVPFDSDENWDTWCLGGRFEKKWATGSVAGTFQITELYRRFGGDFSFRPDKRLTLRGCVDYEQNLDEKTSDRFGAYLFAGYRPIRALEGDLMVDYCQHLAKSWQEMKSSVDHKTGKISVSEAQSQSSDAHETALTIGGRFFPMALFSKKNCDWLSVTADVRVPLENEGSDKKPSLWLKTQVAF